VFAYEDTASIRRYLSGPNQFWVFFVPDRGEPLSISMGVVEADVADPLTAAVSSVPPTVSGTAAPKSGTPTKRAPATMKKPDGTGTKPGAPTSTSIARAPLTLVDVKTSLDKFTIRFTARSAAALK
jgi:hypothetical protein